MVERRTLTDRRKRGRGSLYWARHAADMPDDSRADPARPGDGARRHPARRRRRHQGQAVCGRRASAYRLPALPAHPLRALRDPQRPRPRRRSHATPVRIGLRRRSRRPCRRAGRGHLGHGRDLGRLRRLRRRRRLRHLRAAARAGARGVLHRVPRRNGRVDPACDQLRSPIVAAFARVLADRHVAASDPRAAGTGRPRASRRPVRTRDGLFRHRQDRRQPGPDHGFSRVQPADGQSPAAAPLTAFERRPGQLRPARSARPGRRAPVRSRRTAARPAGRPGRAERADARHRGAAGQRRSRPGGPRGDRLVLEAARTVRFPDRRKHDPLRALAAHRRRPPPGAAERLRQLVGELHRRVRGADPVGTRRHLGDLVRLSAGRRPRRARAEALPPHAPGARRRLLQRVPRRHGAEHHGRHGGDHRIRTLAGRGPARRAGVHRERLRSSPIRRVSLRSRERCGRSAPVDRGARGIDHHGAPVAGRERRPQGQAAPARSTWRSPRRV